MKNVNLRSAVLKHRIQITFFVLPVSENCSYNTQSSHSTKPLISQGLVGSEGKGGAV